MKLFKYTCGDIEMFAPAEDEKEAYSNRELVYAPFHYLPVVVEELKVEGYTINVTADDPVQGKSFSEYLDALDREGLKSWLTDRNIEFTPQWGEQKLRELALSVT